MAVLALALTILAAQLPQAPPSAADLAARIQRHYAGVRDFTADFELHQTTRLDPKPVVNRGRVAIKKPGKMRWTYTTGDRFVMVSDGSKIYQYFPRDRYVVPSDYPTGDQASTPLLFLAGQGDLTRDFVPALPSTHPPGEWHLVLTPTHSKAEFTSLVVQVDRTTLSWRGLVVTDTQGGVQRFRFSNLRENSGVPDSTFVFRIPSGVEIR
jgi:outer membrane lipoprotein carrier protein